MPNTLPRGRGPGCPDAAVYTLAVNSRVVAALLALGAALACPSSLTAEDPAATLSLMRPRPAKDAPDFQVRTPDDRTLSLGGLRGKVVFLNFWATWCEPCREEMPALERLHRSYKDRGLVVLAVSTDTQGASVVRPFAKQYKLTFDLGLDPKMSLAATYQVWAVPSTYIIDRRGKRVLYANGAREWDSKAAHALIEGLLK